MRHQSLRRAIAASAVAVAVSLASQPVMADEYNPRRAGHPLRLVAYAIHPVGVVADYLLFRLAHWVGSWTPVAVLFGHELNLEERDEPSRGAHSH